MRVVLLSEESSLGKKGDILEVADGHARNYLIPKGLASRATDGLELQAESMRKTRELKEAKDIETAKEIAERLGSVTISVSVKASDEGKLYGSVNDTEIVKAIEEQHKIILEKSSIKISNNHIKDIGSFPVEISPHKEVSFSLTLEVTAE